MSVTFHGARYDRSGGDMTTWGGWSQASVKANGWSHALGVSLRPWSGQSPLSLVSRGAIQLAISIFFIVLASRLRSGSLLTVTVDEQSQLRSWALLIMIAAVLAGLIGVLKIAVGLLDLGPRREVSGIVQSLDERKFLDVLPRFAQRQLFERGDYGHDRRGVRTEVVLSTDRGLQRWTVRRAKTQRELQVGNRVTLTVTPLAGYVAQVRQTPY